MDLGLLNFSLFLPEKKFFSCYFGFQYNPEGWDGEREAGGRIRMGNTCKSMADSCQCMAKNTTIKKKLKKKRNIDHLATNVSTVSFYNIHYIG